MKYRIEKYEKGFVVEIQKRKWYGKIYWTHFISVSGIASEPWFHSSYKFAEINLLKEVKWQTIGNSNNTR